MKSATLLVASLFAVTLVLASSASAGQKPKNQVLANATVKTLAMTSITVTAAGKDTTFSIDAKTKVVGKGVGTKSESKGGKATIVDLLKAGDNVTVTYQANGSDMHASLIEKR